MSYVIPSRAQTTYEPVERRPANWWHPLPGVLLVFVLRVPSEHTANLAYAIVAAYALTGHAQAVHSFAMFWMEAAYD
jgi:hypothetical protein